MEVIQLVKQAQKGNKEALLTLIMAEKDRYYRLAYTYMDNPHDAMDALEEMIVKVYESIGGLRKEEVFYSWSKTILVNCCKNMLKKRNKLVLVEKWEEELTNQVDAAADNRAPYDSRDPYAGKDSQLDLQALLLELNVQQKEAIELKYYHDLDYKTIASMTAASVGTVKSRIFQGLRKLRTRYGGDGDE